MVGSPLVLLYSCGGLLIGLRLRALDLPAEAAVAVLPKSVLLVASLRTIGPGLVVGTAVWWATRRRGEFDVALMVVAVLAVTGLQTLFVRPVEEEWPWFSPPRDAEAGFTRIGGVD